MAVYTEEGRKEVKQQVSYYMRNARTIYDGLKEAGYQVAGGVNSPYVWLHTGDMTSWNSLIICWKTPMWWERPAAVWPSGEHLFPPYRFRHV